MATIRKEIVANYQELRQEWNRKPQNLQKIGQMLKQLKNALTRITFLPTSESSPADSAVIKQDLIIARDILEIGALHSVAVKDTESFQRYVAQLKCYYFDYSEDELPESVFKYQLLGLNLLRLLSENRVADFHTELELLSEKVIREDVYILHPVSLEQWLMEGRYNKVFLSKGHVPAESYNYFIDKLIETIRVEIAACIEKAYDQMSLPEAARILFLDSTEDVKKFMAKHNKHWVIRGKQLILMGSEDGTDASDKNKIEKIRCEELAAQAIEYARELEMIV